MTDQKPPYWASELAEHEADMTMPYQPPADDQPITGQLTVEANPAVDTFAIAADEWAGMTPKERRELLDGMAIDHLNNSGGYGWNLDDTDRDDDLIDADLAIELESKDAAAIVGTNEHPGILDRYTVKAFNHDGQAPFVAYHCDRSHNGTANGYVGLIARDLQLDQTGLTLGELVRAALDHEQDEH